MSNFVINSYVFATGGGPPPPTSNYSKENDTEGTSDTINAISIDVSTWGIQRGDYLIAAMVGDNHHNERDLTGFYFLSQRQNLEPYHWLGARRCDGTETTITGTDTTADAFCYALIHVRGVKPIRRLHVNHYRTTTGMPDPPIVYDGDNAAAALIIGFLDDDLVTATAPSGFTLLGTVSHTYSVYNSSLMVAIDESPTLGQDPAAFGGGGTDAWHAITLSLFSEPDPADVTGLKLWLDASDADTLYTDTAKTTKVASDGDAVAAWADKSGNANDVTQATAASRPAYKTGIRGGDLFSADLSIVRFDGTDDVLNSANLAYSALTGNAADPGAQTCHVFAVMRQDNASAINPLLYHGSGATNKLEIRPTDTDTIEFFFPDETGGALTVAQPTGWDDSYHLVEVWRDYGDMEIRTEDLQKASTAAATGSASHTGNPVKIGSDGTDYFDGDVCELLVFNVKLSAEDQASLVEYLSNKWRVPTGTFDPSHITQTDCTTWLDADDIDTLFTDEKHTTNVTTDADTVACWRNKVNNYHPSINLTADEPVYKTAIHNGKDCLRFDGVNHRLYDRYQRIDELYSGTAGEIFIVAYPDTDTVTDYIFSMGGSASNAFFIGHTATNLNCEHTNNILNPSHPALYYDNLHLYDLWRDGADMELLLDGVSLATHTTAAGTGNWFGAYFSVGCSFTAGNEFNGDICEIIVFKEKLSTADRARVKSYLDAKWGT